MIHVMHSPTRLEKRLDQFEKSLAGLEDKIAEAPQGIKLSFYRELDDLKVSLEKLQEAYAEIRRARPADAERAMRQKFDSFETTLKDAHLRITDKNLRKSAKESR